MVYKSLYIAVLIVVLLFLAACEQSVTSPKSENGAQAETALKSDTNEQTVTETEVFQQVLSDSLELTADSLTQERNILSGIHKHKRRDLAENAHQDPERTRKGTYNKAIRTEGRRKSLKAAFKAAQTD